MSAFALLPPRFLTSKHETSLMNLNLNPRGDGHYAVLCYANHELYKVIVVGMFLSDAHAIVDVLRTQHQKKTAEDFAEWIEREFPGEVCAMTQPEIDRFFL